MGLPGWNLWFWNWAPALSAAVALRWTPNYGLRGIPPTLSAVDGSSHCAKPRPPIDAGPSLLSAGCLVFIPLRILPCCPADLCGAALPGGGWLLLGAAASGLQVRGHIRHLQEEPKPGQHTPTPTMRPSSALLRSANGLDIRPGRQLAAAIVQGKSLMPFLLGGLLVLVRCLVRFPPVVELRHWSGWCRCAGCGRRCRRTALRGPASSASWTTSSTPTRASCATRGSSGKDLSALEASVGHAICSQCWPRNGLVAWTRPYSCRLLCRARFLCFQSSPSLSVEFEFEEETGQCCRPNSSLSRSVSFLTEAGTFWYVR
jgi:hypothetical protein